MRGQAIVLAAALLLAPLGAQVADLVEWWQKGYYAKRTRRSKKRSPPSSREAATGRDTFVEDELPGKIAAALEAGQPPDFAHGLSGLLCRKMGLRRATARSLRRCGPLFRSLRSGRPQPGSLLLDAKTGQKALYGLPIGRSTNHIHVWKKLFWTRSRLSPSPKFRREWEAFWSFWCDEVQPAVRRATGRKDIWGIGAADVGGRG